MTDEYIEKLQEIYKDCVMYAFVDKGCIVGVSNTKFGSYIYPIKIRFLAETAEQERSEK